MVVQTSQMYTMNAPSFVNNVGKMVLNAQEMDI